MYWWYRSEIQEVIWQFVVNSDILNTYRCQKLANTSLLHKVHGSVKYWSLLYHRQISETRSFIRRYGVTHSIPKGEFGACLSRMRIATCAAYERVASHEMFRKHTDASRFITHLLCLSFSDFFHRFRTFFHIFSHSDTKKKRQIMVPCRVYFAYFFNSIIYHCKVVPTSPIRYFTSSKVKTAASTKSWT